jgi:hypothetical protein
MSTEVPKPPKTPPADGPLDPDNFHITSEPASPPEGLLPPAPEATAKGGAVTPDNFHITDKPSD